MSKLYTLTLISSKELSNHDLPIISLYIENEKKSNGGEILSLKLDENQVTLTIVFKNLETKQRISKNKILSFRFGTNKYELHVCASSEIIKMKNILCIKNLKKNFNVEQMEIFAEYLDLDNELIRVFKSSIIPKTYFVEYENIYNINELSTRASRYHDLFGDVKLIECYQPALTPIEIEIPNNKKNEYSTLIPQNEIDATYCHYQTLNHIKSKNSTFYFNSKTSKLSKPWYSSKF